MWPCAPTCDHLCPHAHAPPPTPTRPPGLHLHLDSLRSSAPSELAAGEPFKGNVLMHPSAKVGSGCVIGPDVSIGEGCVIGDGVRLSNCVIMRGVKVRITRGGREGGGWPRMAAVGGFVAGCARQVWAFGFVWGGGSGGRVEWASD